MAERKHSIYITITSNYHLPQTHACCSVDLPGKDGMKTELVHMTYWMPSRKNEAYDNCSTTTPCPCGYSCVYQLPGCSNDSRCCVQNYILCAPRLHLRN